ncbi:nucleoside hydrolase [Lepidopterella palustris CBS 459.81]|uniref:Nucleoside hydrolase n=1 Tax=Lepidopterella palustris CBS 459.81 TaxID=1314670 RepID=A0A8E2EAV3_9PEZI|nr:nucleoside hydrolase [Lepidopterella palustris CBS 459.81]
MAPRNRIIIDTDPGVDDVLAMLLAFSAKPEELEVLLLSVTFGNVDVQNCLRNIVSIFHFIEKEREWRRGIGRPEGFETLKACKPIVAVGAEEPLADQIMMADFFHGIDGLGGIHSSHPHLSPAETWKCLFNSALSSTNPSEVAAAREVQDSHSLFTPSQRPAHEEMLRLLRENDPDTITIVAIGPLTNLATAAAIDPEAFLRAKEVVIMGGAIDVPGNMTPGAEFNTYADSVAAARVFALTSPNPASTMPPMPPAPQGKQAVEPHPPFLAPYPAKLSKRLKLTLFPLDITTPHELTRGAFTAYTAPLLSPSSTSPLAEWSTAFLTSTFSKIEFLTPDLSGPAVGLQLHDPMCIWYCLTPEDPKWVVQELDVRVETSGQWTRGCCVVDRRGRRMMVGEDGEGEKGGGGGEEVGKDRWVEGDGDAVGDAGGWLSRKRGNRIRVCVGSPGVGVFGGLLLERVFG